MIALSLLGVLAVGGAGVAVGAVGAPLIVPAMLAPHVAATLLRML